MSGIVFLGTPGAAVPSLLALADQISLVITQPDRPRGRSSRPQPPPVKVAATELGLSVAQPESKTELASTIAEEGFSLGVTVAYGRILTPGMLASTENGFVNVHFSVLPRWRGAAPVQHAILAGDTRTGVSIMRMDEGLDTGPILASTSTAIGPDENIDDLSGRLAELGARLLSETLPLYRSGRVIAVPQPPEGVTVAPKVGAAEERLDPLDSAIGLSRRVRAMYPAGHFGYEDERIRVLQTAPTDARLQPGQLKLSEGRLICGCGDGALVLQLIQPAGKRPMTGEAWARGRRGELGSVT